MMLGLGVCLREVGRHEDGSTEVQKWFVRVGCDARNLVYSFYVDRGGWDVYRR